MSKEYKKISYFCVIIAHILDGSYFQVMKKIKMNVVPIAYPSKDEQGFPIDRLINSIITYRSIKLFSRPYNGKSFSLGAQWVFLFRQGI